MWPSRIERTVSATGSLKSSPSTRTVKKPVIVPLSAGAGALQEARQVGEHARRVAAQRRGLAGGQADLALGHRQAGHGVHEQDHVAAVVAERLGDRHRHLGGLEAQQRRLVGRGHDHHGPLEALRARAARR